VILPESLTSFLFYLLFLGPGEEFLFRGYIQSRLNAAFGRPFSFWGVPWGWGLVIASLLFGFMHILNPFNPFHIWWGVWTVFGGLSAGYIREKTGSILPPAILHGLPQAIASLMIGFFSIR
jgi:membrane protease YdiL (CAAX protease family)